ncbi:MAG: hypothetical protein COB53_04025 [Elusimicrobia bacterium]|nr:MAG: hypothetical protein COB53_04025 [Elusimicrobiota bacterium]
MRTSIIFLSAAALLPSLGSARVVGKGGAVRVGGNSVFAPIVFQSGVRGNSPSLAVPSLTGTLPTLAVSPFLRKEIKAARAVPSPTTRLAAIAILREGVKRTEKKQSTAKKSAALTGMFDGGSLGASVPGLSSSVNPADSSSERPVPVLRPVAGSVFSRVRRPWLGPMKSLLFRTWNEVQRIRRGKARVFIGDAREDELERLVEITDFSRLDGRAGESEKELSKSGFLAWTYSVEYFKKFMHHPDARILVARNRKGVVEGFLVVYGKGVMVPGQEDQEFNLLARRAVEAAYGPKAEFLLGKLMASDPNAPRGMGRQISNYVIAVMLEYGIDLIATTLVNDEPLRGTRFDIPKSKLLHNDASSALAKKVNGRQVATGFMYGHNKEKFDRDIRELETGIHAFDMYALSLNKKKPFPAVAVPSGNLPD